MTARQDHTDRDIARAFRDASVTYRGSLEALAARIEAAAAPILAARFGRPALAWWDYAAQWGNALIPASVLLSFASIACLIVIRPPVPQHQPRPTSVVAERTVRGNDAVDNAIDDLIGLPSRPIRRIR